MSQIRMFAERSKHPLENMTNSKLKLRWFGRISMSPGLSKTILHSIKKKEQKVRQKKRLEDNIKEWTGIDFASSTRTAEDRTRWKGTLQSELARLWDRRD